MSVWVLDTECYVDYFLVMLRDIESGRVCGTEMFPGSPPFSCVPLDMTVVTFNGNNYDFPILSLAFAGADNTTLKAASDDIILRNMKPWDIRDKYGGVPLDHIDHIDLIEVAPGQCGLKAYGGRLHSRKLQDLPIDPSANISPEQRVQLREYCGNDLQITEDLYRKLKPQIDLRTSMSAEFGIDLRSKSDAQIAEAVIRKEVERSLGYRVYRPDINPRYRFNYRVPSFIAFSSPGMNQALDIIRAAEFTLDHNGAVVMPKHLASMRLRIGNGVYQMGIGGLHSTESSVCHRADATTKLRDIDATSFYPNIILTQQLYPAHLGPAFLSVYRDIVDRRVAAKRAGDSVTNEALKVVINGGFGKFGSMWSVLYSPDLMIQVTLTGQLALLMLIELIESIGVPIISANTDGVVVKCPTNRTEEVNAIIAAWEIVSGLATEETEYAILAAKDVNNYIAIKTDGEAKQKGIYAFVGSKKSELEKNPTNQVCIDAVVAYLGKGVPIEGTVLACMDIRRFLSTRAVKGGATYDGKYLGKNVRWYCGTGEKRAIEYTTNGNKVARSDGAVPCMELPESIPLDLDYDWYIEEARAIMGDIGL